MSSMHTWLAVVPYGLLHGGHKVPARMGKDSTGAQVELFVKWIASELHSENIQMFSLTQNIYKTF